MLRNHGHRDVAAIVVTDGERVLGLGDQGAGGMGISIGKLSLYVACGGIHPARTLPVLLDVGTNNEERLRDPEYVGWRHERVTGGRYLRFVDDFVDAVKLVWPQALLQFEDFAIQNATSLLERYRESTCMFNDDVQGTAAVTLGALLSATRRTGSPLKEQTIVLAGAGSAGCGIASQVVSAMVERGLSDGDARQRVLMVDRAGLLHDAMADLRPFQKPLAQPFGRVASWVTGDGRIPLLEVVRHARPTILIGVSGQRELFTEHLVRTMAGLVERPIVFPLSNPPSRMEAAPADLFAWTDGRAVVATGSPVGHVERSGRRIAIAQCNNDYVFPAIALGVLASGARRVTDGMFRAAAQVLAENSPVAPSDSAGPRSVRASRSGRNRSASR